MAKGTIKHAKYIDKHAKYLEELANRNTDMFGQPLGAMGKATRAKAAKIIDKEVRKKNAKRYPNQK